MFFDQHVDFRLNITWTCNTDVQQHIFLNQPTNWSYKPDAQYEFAILLF